MPPQLPGTAPGASSPAAPRHDAPGRTDWLRLARRTAQEGININQSLLTLGNVIRCLAVPALGLPPYRSAKLTHLLKDCLGSNSLTVMIACVSPSACSLEESTQTLKCGAARPAARRPASGRISSAPPRSERALRALRPRRLSRPR